MNKLLLLLILPITIIYAACNNSNKEVVENVKPGTMELRLKINGNSLVISVPDSTIGHVEIIDQVWGATEIKVGKNFQIAISEGKGDITLKKNDIAGDEINKFKRYIKEEPATLFWESAIVDPEFHFYSIEKAGPVFYQIEDIKENHFTEKDIHQMLEAAKTLKLEADAKPAS